MFTPIVTVFKRSKIATVFVFSTDNSKKSFFLVWAMYLSTHGRYQVIAETGIVNRLRT